MLNHRIYITQIVCSLLFLICIACDDPPPTTSSPAPNISLNDQSITDDDAIITHPMTSNDMTSNLMIDQDLSFDLDYSYDMNPPRADMEDIELEVSDTPGYFKVYVTLDGQAVSDATLVQGGSHHQWTLDEMGSTWVTLDSDILDSFTLMASHPKARTRSKTIEADRKQALVIELESASTPDQTDYIFSDPGEPTRRNTTAQCGHCHLTINDQWFDSPHRQSAKNKIVYDLYTGRGSGHQNANSCQQAGGQWQMAAIEGQDRMQAQCFFEIAALSAFNETCTQPPCEINPQNSEAYFGGCADCHAPAINGVIGGGQDLMSVRGDAFEYGVSCDLCHHVTKVDLQADAGVAGRLILHRPRERASPSLGGGGFLPLSFGPSLDVSNPRMGLSPRTHYRSGTLCAGCHQHDHQNIHGGLPINIERWPDGKIPNQSTYQEWKTSELGDQAPCNECHMPPIAGLMNSSHLEKFASADVGVQGGWPRAHGDTRAHSWIGPRQADSRMLQLAASLQVHAQQINRDQVSHVESLNLSDDSLWAINVNVSNVGAGHVLPTGEPMRHLLLLVDLLCESDGSLVRLNAVAGDAVHDIGGAWQQSIWDHRDELWSVAQPGDMIRVVRKVDEYYEYDGYRDFAINGRFTPADKGLQTEHVIGEARIIEIEALEANGDLMPDANSMATNNQTPSTDRFRVVLSQFLDVHTDDEVYLIVAPNSELHPQDYPIAPQYAGRSGFSFARVMQDQNAQKMVPHFVAYDLIRDNRILPNQSWQTQHYFPTQFPSQCEEIILHTQLIYRPYPWWLAQQRAWFMWDQVMAEVKAPLSLVSNLTRGIP